MFNLKIKVTESKPINGQEAIEDHVGKVYKVLQLSKIYDKETIDEMNQLGEVAVYLNEKDKFPSILNKDEYEIVTD